ncbi:TetR/AcrR family transcriptional regulator [Paenibacillus rhizolycopersici]|uniref:TetR/AcrR family transcriptional regulator n=1 Tax=Paenibacillus rhizolycopersici TaxID=2780073 RepID=UPI003D2E27F8
MARAKQFDEDTVLLKAMKLFWEQGYERTSMQDLVEQMGVHKRSMYDTFGDKHSLYVRALNRYQEVIAKRMAEEMHGARSTKEAIRALFEMVIYPETGFPAGCLMVNTAVELATIDADARAFVTEGWAHSEIVIRGLIEAGQRSDELDPSLNAEELASYFNNALAGLRVMVKTVEDKEKLVRIVDTTLSLLK